METRKRKKVSIEEPASMIIPTESIPYVPINGLEGVALKRTHNIPAGDELSSSVRSPMGVWSAVLRLDAGAGLPEGETEGLCEMLVIEGKGSYSNGPDFAAGDYLRETTGTYDAIQAEETLLLFVTHHGTWKTRGTSTPVTLAIAD